VQSLVKL
jgi:hypothetical protein